MILDTNRYLFILGAVVSVLHSLFEFLALKQDIQFWRNVKSHKGLSLKTLYMNLFTEVVIFLYLLDNETSKMIVIGCVSGIGVSLWKIYSTSKFKVKS
jgi:hypothetical protein